MVTPEQLAVLLRGVNVAEVARVSSVSTKTIYRLRNYNPAGKTAPNVKTVRRLLDAIAEVSAARQRKARKVAA